MIFGQSISLPQFGNWGKFEVENTGAPSWILPQFPIWGKNLSWGTGVKSFLNWGTSVTNNEFAPIPNWGKVQLGAPVFQLWTCPNSELGQCPTWGTSDFNFGLAPIPNWGNTQLGTPVFQLWTCPNSELGQCPTWGTSVSTLDLPQFQTGAMSNLGHQ